MSCLQLVPFSYKIRTVETPYTIIPLTNRSFLWLKHETRSMGRLTIYMLSPVDYVKANKYNVKAYDIEETRNEHLTPDWTDRLTWDPAASWYIYKVDSTFFWFLPSSLLSVITYCCDLIFIINLPVPPRNIPAIYITMTCNNQGGNVSLRTFGAFLHSSMGLVYVSSTACLATFTHTHSTAKLHHAQVYFTVGLAYTLYTCCTHSKLFIIYCYLI